MLDEEATIVVNLLGDELQGEEVAYGEGKRLGHGDGEGVLAEFELQVIVPLHSDGRPACAL